MYRQLFVSVIFIIGALGLWTWLYPTSTIITTLGLDRFAPAQEAPAGRRWGGGATTVVTTPLSSAPIQTTLRALGSASSPSSLTLTSPIAGTLKTRLVSPGDRVQEGDILFQLDEREATIALNRAQQSQRTAFATLERTQTLRDRSISTQTALETAQNTAALATLDVEQAQLFLDDHTITAPFSGLIGAIDIPQGAPLTQQTALTTLKQVDPLIVKFSLPERLYTQVNLKETVSLIPLSQPQTTLNGTLIFKDRQIDTGSRTFQVDVALENAEDLYQPGMSFELVLTTTGKTAFKTSPVSVRWSDTGAHIWVVREEKAVRVPVVVEQITTDFVMVTGDINDNDQVIVEGMTSVRNGQAVEIQQ